MADLTQPELPRSILKKPGSQVQYPIPQPKSLLSRLSCFTRSTTQRSVPAKKVTLSPPKKSNSSATMQPRPRYVASSSPEHRAGIQRLIQQRREHVQTLYALEEDIIDLRIQLGELETARYLDRQQNGPKPRAVDAQIKDLQKEIEGKTAGSRTMTNEVKTWSILEKDDAGYEGSRFETVEQVGLGWRRIEEGGSGSTRPSHFSMTAEFRGWMNYLACSIIRKQECRYA